jgi:TRAP-type C4-dicarboxylate transport system permease small subunit
MGCSHEIAEGKICRRILMRNFVNLLANITKISAGILLGAMTIMVAIVILGRYLALSVPWADELARMLFIWSALLGAASATHNKLHFSVSFLTSYFGKTTRRTLGLLSGLLIISIMAFILVAAIGALQIAKIQILPALQISKVSFHLPVSISAILIMFFAVNHILNEYIKLRK